MDDMEASYMGGTNDMESIGCCTCIFCCIAKLVPEYDKLSYTLMRR